MSELNMMQKDALKRLSLAGKRLASPVAYRLQRRLPDRIGGRKGEKWKLTNMFPKSIGFWA
jgi:hypothetical protein